MADENGRETTPYTLNLGPFFVGVAINSSTGFMYPFAGVQLEASGIVGLAGNAQVSFLPNSTIVEGNAFYSIGPQFSVENVGVGQAVQKNLLTGETDNVTKVGPVEIQSQIQGPESDNPLSHTFQFGLQDANQFFRGLIGAQAESQQLELGVPPGAFMGSVGPSTDVFGNVRNLATQSENWGDNFDNINIDNPTVTVDLNAPPSLPVPSFSSVGQSTDVFGSTIDLSSAGWAVAKVPAAWPDITATTTWPDAGASGAASSDVFSTGTATDLFNQYSGLAGLGVSASSNNALSIASLPVDTSANAFPVSGAQPIGYIDTTTYYGAFYDPAVFGQLTSTSSSSTTSVGNTYNPIFSGGDGGDGGGGIGGGDGFGDGGDGGSSGSPIVLDVAGALGLPDTGINITQLSSSNTFFDMTGSGHENRTAWAGKGNGVLFYDPTGHGQLTQEKQIVFTDWDPGAKSDMQALEDVFDTNHDGSLDSGDANFNNFFVMVTNADGSETEYSLAQLGITSINLNANTTNITLPDGSSISGETTYTTSSGSTGTAATVTFAYGPNGYAVTTTTTTNADGSTTIDNVALNADGSVAYSLILNTLISSSTSGGVTTVTTDKTLTNLNAGGVVTTIQTDDTTSTGSSSAETVTNYTGGTISSIGELTGAGVSNSEKLNSTTTTTAPLGGGTQVTILRDQLGGGWTTQEEVDTYTSTGALSSTVVSNLNPDGSVSDVTTTTLSAGGETRTVTGLVDNIAADSTTSIDAIVVSGSTQTETVTNCVGTTVTSNVQTVTVTAANSVTRTTTSDLTDGSTLNLTSVAQTVTSGSDSTTTQTDTSANGTLLDQVVTTNTPESGGGLVTAVTSSEIDGYGHFIETGSTTNTISNAGATATTTVVNDSANGTLLSESITTSTVGSAATSVTIYGNGDGEVTQSQTVAVSGGTTTDTVENSNADGSLTSETLTVTSAGGLSKTTSVDSTGAGTAAAPVFDHITTDVTTTSGGSSTEIVTDYGATTGNEIDRTQTVVSANGLTTTIYKAFTSASLSGGTWDQISTDQTIVNSDGSLSEIINVTDGTPNVLETTQKTTSANRQVVTTTTTLGATNLVKTVETVTTESNGTVQDQVVKFDQLGDVIGATVTTTTADGLVKTVQNDIQGQSSGLAFDSTTTDTTVINADGSRTETGVVTSQNGTQLSATSVLTSANGLSVTTTANPYATTHYATQTTDVTVLNTDGSRTETVAEYSYNETLIDRTATTTSASGLSKTTLHDLNGDGVTDQSTTDVATTNADGSQTETVTDYTGGTNGTVRDVTTTHSGIVIAGAGLTTTVTRQSNGSVPTYQVETILPSANGTVTDTTQYYAQSGGPLLLQTQVTTSANGLVKTTGTAVNGDTSTDFYVADAIVLNANGSQTETVGTYYNKSGTGPVLVSDTVTITFANGLSKTTEVDANGALSGSNPVFNLVTTDNTVLNTGDGSRTETITASATNGATTEQTVTTTSADQQTTTTSRYFDETGNITNVDQSETIQTQSNGSVIDTISSYNANATNRLIGTVIKTTSGNGLVKSTVYENASGTPVDTQTDTTAYDLNGDGGTSETFQDTDVAAGITFTTSRTTQTTGNDQSKTTTLVLTGALSTTTSYSVVANDSTAIADTGATTETITDKINGASSTNDTTTIVTSANQMTTTSSTSLGGASPYIVQQTSVALDGSKSQVTTYYDPDSSSVIASQTTVNTSYDGRTATTTRESDYDQLGQTIVAGSYTFTPAFSGAGYNIETDASVENANGTTTETRSDTGSFGAPASAQTVTTVTNADSSLTTTTLNYDGSGNLTGQIVADTSPDGLVKSFAYDTTGKETLANLDAAAADLIAGTALPTSMLVTDIIEIDKTTLNANGSKTEVVETAYGDGSADPRSETTIETSADGLVTTTYVDNNGIGVYEEIETATVEPDGSKTEVFNYYDDKGGATQQIGGMTVGANSDGYNTYKISANGLVTTSNDDDRDCRYDSRFCQCERQLRIFTQRHGGQSGGDGRRRKWKCIALHRRQRHRYLELEQRIWKLGDDYDRCRDRKPRYRDCQRDLSNSSWSFDGRRRDAIPRTVHRQWCV